MAESLVQIIHAINATGLRIEDDLGSLTYISRPKLAAVFCGHLDLVINLQNYKMFSNSVIKLYQ